MSEAEVLYSDVKFTKERGRAHAAASPAAETPYSEVRTFQKEPTTQVPAGSQKHPEEAGGRCSAGRAALCVLCVLLTASVVALGLSYYKNIQTAESLQKLKDENEAVKRNLTEKQHELQRRTGLGAAGAPTECPQTERCWERHRGSCYYFSSSKFTWKESKQECQRLGGGLVKIDSGEEQTFLELRLREKMNAPEDKFWIGLTDRQKESEWRWTDGSLLDQNLTFWSLPEPDDWKGENAAGEDCVRMGEKAGAADLKCWFDKSCTEPHRHICERPPIEGFKKCVKF